MTDPQALRSFRESLFGHALTMSQKADVLMTLSECADEIERLQEMVDRAHEALNELLTGRHLNIGEPAYDVARRGIWGDSPSRGRDA